MQDNTDRYLEESKALLPGREREGWALDEATGDKLALAKAFVGAAKKTGHKAKVDKRGVVSFPLGRGEVTVAFVMHPSGGVHMRPYYKGNPGGGVDAKSVDDAKAAFPKLMKNITKMTKLKPFPM